MEGEADLPYSNFHSLCSFRGTPGENCHQHQAGDENRHADKLPGREAEMMVGGIVIAAEVLDERANDGVTNEVGGEDLTVEFLAAEKPREKEVEPKIQEGVIDFRGVHRRGGSAQWIVGRETDGPGQIAGAAVAAAIPWRRRLPGRAATSSTSPSMGSRSA